MSPVPIFRLSRLREAAVIQRNQKNTLNDSGASVATFSSYFQGAKTPTTTTDSKSDTKQPAYVLIQNKVYDVQDFVSQHPGGDVILTHVNGEDATGFDALVVS